MSTPSSITSGSLPPSSRKQGISRPPAAAPTFLPVATEPVKCTKSTSGCSINADPVDPLPRTMFTTPGGRQLKTSDSAATESGAFSLGFTTTVFPADRRAPITSVTWQTG